MSGELGKIYERDDEAGDQTEDTLAEELERICKLKQQLQRMVDSYEAKVSVWIRASN